MNRRFLYGAFLCFIACVSWGAMFPVASYSFQYVEPFHFTIVRYVPVALILVILLLMKEGKKAFRTEGKGLSLWFFGTMAFTVYNLFIFWGQNALGKSGTLLASIMEALMPLISVLIIWGLKGDRPKVYTMISIGIAFIGVLSVITKGDFTALVSSGGQILPLAALLASVIGWVIYTLGGGGFSDWSILRYSTLTCLYGTITATVIVLLATAIGWVEFPTFSNVYAIKWHIAFMIIFPGLIALLGWNVGVNILKPVNALLFINFVPVTTVIITFIQGHAINKYELIGIILVVAGLMLNNLFQRSEFEKKDLNKTRSDLQSVS